MMPKQSIHKCSMNRSKKRKYKNSINSDDDDRNDDDKDKLRFYKYAREPKWAWQFFVWHLW